MRVPHDLFGAKLVKRLERLGYSITLQSGSHLHLTSTAHGDHHVTIQNHDSLRIGTLTAILPAAAAHYGIDRNALLQ